MKMIIHQHFKLNEQYLIYIHIYGFIVLTKKINKMLYLIIFTFIVTILGTIDMIKQLRK